MSGGIRIDENFRLRIVYQDESPFGSAVSGECDETIRSLCPDIVSAWKQSGLRDVILCGRQMLEAAFQRGAFAPLYLSDTTIRPDVLYPSPVSIRPAALEVSCRTTGLSEVCALPPALMAELSLWLGDWFCGAFTPRQSPAAELWKQLNDLGALTDQPRPAPSRHAATPGVTFVGHATVKVTSEKGSILIDPFLLPPSLLYPPTYQPLSIDELGRPDAVFITHSHPDHFDLGTLLSLGPDMPVYVPVVGRESLLAIDMAYRLEELGFRNVREMKWFDQIRVGDLRVTALPFYGEQPSSDEVLHPEVRNEGNTYLVEDGADRYAFIADAGRDRDGSPLRVAQEARRRFGDLSVLFGGYRAFATYPVHYIFSSIARYLLFLPSESWGVRQKIMNDADDLLDVAEAWNAGVVVPYADGGAPWYWELGLGPRLDTLQAASANPAIDPPPEHVIDVAQRRSGSSSAGLIPSPIPVKILRPCDTLSAPAQGGRVLRRSPHAWPYFEKTSALSGLTHNAVSEA